MNKLLATGLGLALGTSALLAQAAEPFPTKPIRMIVPYPAGGSTDQLARAIQQPMSDILGQPIIVENKPGAGGTLGTDAAAKSPADGYTLVFGNTGPNAVVSLMRKVPYDLVTDLQPISTVVTVPMVLAVPTEGGPADLKAFLAQARAKGNAWNFGSVGVGSASHLTGAYLNELAGTAMEHVPYNGGAPMITAFGGGQLQAAFVTGLDGAAMVRAGKVRYIGVGTPQRTDVLPGLPAIAEQVPGFKSVVWFGVLAPKGLPPEVAAKLHAAIVQAVNKPDVRKLFLDRNVEPHTSTPEELAQLIKAERDQWSPIIKKYKIEM
ncbi:MAG: tripartite tricarboxylate transporter substrate binding protein [Burkholderiales bacterium]